MSEIYTISSNDWQNHADLKNRRVKRAKELMAYSVIQLARMNGCQTLEEAEKFEWQIAERTKTKVCEEMAEQEIPLSELESYSPISSLAPDSPALAKPRPRTGPTPQSRPETRKTAPQTERIMAPKPATSDGKNLSEEQRRAQQLLANL